MEGDQALQRLSADYLSLLSGGGAAGVGSGEGGTLSSDVSFCVEGRQVHAHRCILAARSHFFRLMFAQAHEQTSAPAHSSSSAQYLHMLSSSSSSFNNGRPPIINSPLLIPVDVVGFDAFLSLLRFLYSGQLLLSLHHPSSPCPLPSCPHSSCSSAVDLLLQLIHAAHFFGVHQLADLVQIKLGNVLEEGVSVESLMKVLVMAKKHKMQHLWHSCTDLVIRTGLSCDILRRYLPREVIAELGEMRLHTSQNNMQSCMSNNIHYSLSDHLHSSQNANTSPGSCNMMMCSINGGGCCNEEQRILRLQQALDCMDVELVRLMVMGEGLDLDKALALHYSVANCNRDVVKALLELGFVDVNYGDTLGRTALHLAADMGNAEMIAVLLDHHADPNALTREGFAAVDILRGLIKASNHDHFHHHLHADHHPTVIAPLCKADQKRIHLCIELLQSAAAVAGREEAAESSCITQVAAQQAQIINSQLNEEAIGFMSRSLQLLRDDGFQPIITTDQFNHKTSRTSQSSPVATAALIRDDRMQSIINTQYNQEAASAGTGAAGAPVTLASAIDYHHRANPTRMSPQDTQINGINGEASSLIGARGANNSYVNHCRSLYNSNYAGVSRTGLEPTNSGKIEYSAQEGKSTNTVTGSSSEE